MKRAILLALAGLSFPLLKAQEDISGIINAYAAVQSIDYCNNALQVSTTDGFAEGEALMLIQMQGAAIDVSNTTAYGTVTGLGQAGRYERAVIASINGLEVTLENTLLYEYDTDGAVQIVSMPGYPSGVTITDVLTASAWDGATGGVLAFETTALEMESDISVGGKGFRGGDAALDYTGDCFFTDNYNSFAYPEASIRGGRKGEGISAIASDRARGRGAQANGGGGGNDHNSGGGGGGNVTAGGQGGENDNPSFFGCDGRFPGQGGKATNGIPAERIFMGGGGGAGHGNNNVASDGGNGGGIIIIRATEIISNGFVIDANGEAAANAAGDGAGGGGGGGTIVVDLESGSGNMLALRARGGDGGNANNNNADQCFGPGGGGSGGRILRTAVAGMAVADTPGGDPGLSFNSNACGEGTNNAAPGNDGTALTFEGLPESGEAFAPFQLLAQTGDTSSCTGQPLTLPVTVQGSGLSFQWQADEGSGFTNLQSGLQYGPADVPALLINTVTNAMDGNQYRLQISGDCIGTVFTEPLTLAVVPGPLAAFAFTIDGLEVSFDNTSSNADSYSWTFGDGTNSGQFEPIHTFPGPGIYDVTLTATSNACGQQASFSAQVTLQEAPEANFEPMPAAGCAPLSVVFSNTSTGLGNTYQWFFTGGDPASSTDGAPIVNYNTPGVYDVTLIASNSAGTSTLVISEAVRVGGPPAADFSLSADNLSITLANLSAGADSYLWDFGDGNTSTADNPTHAYSSSGEYEVSLTATNECGSDVLVIAVAIVQQPVPLFSTENTPAGCAPHTVYFVNQSFGDYDSLEWSFPGGMPATSDIPGPEVVYATPGQYDVQLTLFWANGEEALVRPQAVTVLERPEPAFTFTLDGLTATFTNLSANATEYTWNFGDGTTSDEENPVHTFPSPGNYNVTLNASNQGECTRAVGRTVFIEPSAGAEQPLPEGVKVFPNPTAGQLRLQCENPAWYPVQWRLLGPQGEEIASGETQQDRQWELGGLPAGLYLLQFFNEKGWWTVRVVRY